MNSTAATDNELMFQVRDGDTLKLGVLFERHHAKLYRFLVRVTNRPDLSEDFVQDVFVRILRYGHSFRGDTQFTVWLYQLARNVAHDHFRKWRHESRLDETVTEPADERPTGLDSLEQEQRSEMMKTALSRLSTEKREVLVLSRYQDLKYEEIGAILDCPVGTVKARVHRALKDLGDEYFRIARETTSRLKKMDAPQSARRNENTEAPQ